MKDTITVSLSQFEETNCHGWVKRYAWIHWPFGLLRLLEIQESSFELKCIYYDHSLHQTFMCLTLNGIFHEHNQVRPLFFTQTIFKWFIITLGKRLQIGSFHVLTRLTYFFSLISSKKWFFNFLASIKIALAWKVQTCGNII